MWLFDLSPVASEHHSPMWHLKNGQVLAQWGFQLAVGSSYAETLTVRGMGILQASLKCSRPTRD